jgi:hypothetical protein
MPQLEREEFNAYRKTMLQDYLYELIFKEGQSSAGQPDAGGLAMPSFGGDTNGLEITQRLEAVLPLLLLDVTTIQFTV